LIWIVADPICACADTGSRIAAATAKVLKKDRISGLRLWNGREVGRRDELRHLTFLNTQFPCHTSPVYQRSITIYRYLQPVRRQHLTIQPAKTTVARTQRKVFTRHRLLPVCITNWDESVASAPHSSPQESAAPATR